MDHAELIAYLSGLVKRIKDTPFEKLHILDKSVVIAVTAMQSAYTGESTGVHLKMAFSDAAIALLPPFGEDSEPDPDLLNPPPTPPPQDEPDRIVPVEDGLYMFDLPNLYILEGGLS